MLRSIHVTCLSYSSFRVSPRKVWYLGPCVGSSSFSHNHSEFASSFRIYLTHLYPRHQLSTQCTIDLFFYHPRRRTGVNVEGIYIHGSVSCVPRNRSLSSRLRRFVPHVLRETVHCITINQIRTPSSSWRHCSIPNRLSPDVRQSLALVAQCWTH
jgi:hypothetical protein